MKAPPYDKHDLKRMYSSQGNCQGNRQGRMLNKHKVDLHTNIIIRLWKIAYEIRIKNLLINMGRISLKNSDS